MKKLTTLLSLITLALAACDDQPKQADRKPLTHDEQVDVMMTKPKVQIKTVGILLYDNYAVLDAMGPYHVFSELMGTKVFFVGRHKGLITTANNMKVQCDTSIADVKQLDILVIPGGLNETYTATKDTALLNWIKAIDTRSKYTTSVCTGAWILAATGLLRGHDATTHWYGKKLMKDQYGIEAKNVRYVHSGKYWTSAGVSAGIDMSLGVINDIMGEKYTQMVMLDMEYNPQPPVKGGSEDNTDKGIVEGMRGMYDSAIDPLLHPQNAKTNIKIINKTDPSCGMALTAGFADTANYRGNVYGFCSKTCKAKFKQNPAAMLAGK